MRVCVIIPSYNEKDTISEVINTLESEFSDIRKDFSILVVDGYSPDGTGGIVQKLKETYENLHLLEKQKSGLGRDYIAGMEYAIKNLAPEVIFEMDADLQHDPKDARKMLTEIENGYDYVLGSRYVPGGSIPKEWGWHRKFLSGFGNLFARVALGIFSIHDITTGFKASRVSGFLDRIELDRVLSGKQAYKMHLLYEMVRLGAKVKEIPITFANREHGVSKIVGSDLFEALKVVVILGIKKRQTFFKFLSVGFIGLMWQILVYETLIILTKIPAWISVMVSSEAAIISNFILNNLWTFKEKQIGLRDLPLRFLMFNTTSLGAPVIQALVVGGGTFIFGDAFLIKNVFFFLSLILVVIWNYFFYTKVIWAKKDGKR